MNVTIEDGVENEFGVGVIKDTYIASDSPSTNYGSNQFLAINGYYADETHSSCVRVDLSSFSGSTPLNGKLKLIDY